jgi:ubiquinone/menaquinone biosynthesis C-methylase UbiE
MPQHRTRTNNHSQEHIANGRARDRARTSFFDEIAHEWDGMTGPDAEARIVEWCASLRMQPGAFVVDIGCGTGVSSLACARQVRAGGPVLAIDRARNMIGEGKRRRPHPSIVWACADAHRLPVRDESADLLHALHVWPHIDDQSEALRDWHRALRTGGHLTIVHLMSRETVNARHRDASKAVVKDILPPAPIVASSIREFGFTIEDVEDDDDHYLIRAVKL